MSNEKKNGNGSAMSVLKGQAVNALAEARAKRDAIQEVMKTGKADLKALNSDIKALEKITGDKSQAKPRTPRKKKDAPAQEASATEATAGATA